MFTILDKDNYLVLRALLEYENLRRLFTATDEIERNLSLIEEGLVAHIRFEERVLFREIQTLATKEELKKIEQAHSKIIADVWEDEFWIDQ